MRRITILLIAICCNIAVYAQTSRRTIERFATEAVKQRTLTGRTPTIDILDSLANNAEISVEMLSRMGEPDDARQYRACLQTIDAIVDYTLSSSGKKYTDVLRSGLKKALDRSYDTDVQQHMMQLLAKCAKPADAGHIAMYLEVPELSTTAYDILLSMNGIDDRIAEAAAGQPGIKTKVKEILDIHSGRKKAAQPIATVKPKPAAIPFWPTSLNREITEMSKMPQDKADMIIINNAPEKAVQLLADMAKQKPAAEREAVVAKMLMTTERATLTPEQRYLILREADALTTNDNLRRKIIIEMGYTHSIQALTYMRKYYGNANLDDAMALASTEIISSHPEANAGKYAYALLYAAKQSFIRHYDEEGVDTYIDQVLAAIDNWHAEGGYNQSHTEETRMEKRGFWIIHDELANFDIAFDWLTEGDLTLSLRSVPALIFNRQHGARLYGNDVWHKFASNDKWCTANISVQADNITVSVNGQKVIDNARLPKADTEANNKAGFVKFLADDNGAVIRQYSFLKK